MKFYLLCTQLPIVRGQSLSILPPQQLLCTVVVSTYPSRIHLHDSTWLYNLTKFFYAHTQTLTDDAQTDVHRHTHTCTCVWTHTCTCVWTHTDAHMHKQTQTDTHACTHTYSCTDRCMHGHTDAQTHIHTCICTHMHVYTQSCYSHS